MGHSVKCVEGEREDAGLDGNKREQMYLHIFHQHGHCFEFNYDAVRIINKIPKGPLPTHTVPYSTAQYSYVATILC